jgi:hypothetical protein
MVTRAQSWRALALALTVFFVASMPPAAMAGDKEDMAEMQKQLNAGVMAKPFSVEDEAKIDAYVKDAMKKDLKPKESAPSYWQPGWTCNNLYGHYYDYRDCRYYHRYYGRYW